MSAPKWHEGRLAAFDTETTGIDPTDARIVTAAVVHRIPGERPIEMRWIIDPEVDIPVEASDVHGFTNEVIAHRLERLGGNPGSAIRIHKGVETVIPREAAIFEITAQLAGVIGREQALVVHNAPYDLTLLEHEATRHDVEPLTARPAGVVGVVDPMVIEKAFDPYRKSCYAKQTGAACNVEERHHECGGCRGGKWACGGCGMTDRTLTSLCAHYGVVFPADSAHDCAADAIACVRLLFKLLSGWPQMATWKLDTLCRNQAEWRAEQQASLRKFFDKVGKDHDGCCGVWPVHTANCAGAHREVVAA